MELGNCGMRQGNRTNTEEMKALRPTDHSRSPVEKLHFTVETRIIPQHDWGSKDHLRPHISQLGL